MKINNLLKLLNNKYPLTMAEEWDNCGLIIGDKKQIITKVIIAIDLTAKVFEDALLWGAELIITHHPFLFKPDPHKGYKSQFIEYPYKEAIYNRLLNTGICVYSAHTNFDGAEEGMSDTFIKSLDLKPLKIHGVVYGKGTKIKGTFLDFKNILSNHVSIIASNLGEDKSIDKVAFFPGAGSPMELIKAKKNGYDVIVTADVKWSTWILAEHEGINIIQVSHQMEEVFVSAVAKIIKNRFKKIVIKEFMLNKII